MKNKITNITIIIISILLVSVLTFAGTYAIIINVTSSNGISRLVNTVTIRDLLTNDNGTYNSTYYNTFNELNVTNEEANKLMDSVPLNDSLQTVLTSIINYRVNNNQASYLSTDSIYNTIVESINRDTGISEELKNKVINKSNIYIKDISDYLYNLDLSITY